MLFHGTRNNNPKLIYEGIEEGFDFRLSNEGSKIKILLLYKNYFN